MLKTLPPPSDSYRTAHSKPHQKVGIFSGIRYIFHVQSRLKEPIAVLLGIEKVRRFAPQKTGTCFTIKTQSLKDGFQSRLPHQQARECERQPRRKMHGWKELSRMLETKQQCVRLCGASCVRLVWTSCVRLVWTSCVRSVLTSCPSMHSYSLTKRNCPPPPRRHRKNMVFAGRKRRPSAESCHGLLTTTPSIKIRKW